MTEDASCPSRNFGHTPRIWLSSLRRVGESAPSAPIRKPAALAAAMCMTALLVSGCEYVSQPSDPVSASVPASTPSPTSGASSLTGKTELNKFYLPVHYTCAEGDTWETVAREFGIKAEILRSFNKSTVLRADAVIDVRGKDVPQLGASGPFVPNADGTATYTVQANDTLLGITGRFGVPAYALLGANTSLRGAGGELTAHPGELLTIPGTL